ncbi:MAG: hypothetical protein NC218_08265 [Acetobacter sp.]|nr:hypothetical protein [Acetobacter sp.]
MTYQFKGQVKVSEIQSAFDDMIARVNALREKYTEALGAANYNIAIGGSELGPNRYTLSVGGLKTILAAMNGQVFNSRVFKYNNRLFVSNGLYVEDTDVISLPAGVVSGTAGKYIYFNITSKQYTRYSAAQTNNDLLLISIVNTEESNGVCDIVDCTANADKTRIFVGNTAIGRWDHNPPNTSIDNFVCGFLADHVPGVPTIRFKGQDISWCWRTTSHNGKQCQYYDKFFLPKGVPNPFTGTSGTNIKSFPVIKEG